MQIVDLSHTIVTGMDQFPGDTQAVQLSRQAVHSDNEFLTSAIAMGCHVGTHIDTPYHFLDGQPPLEQLSIEMFRGRARIFPVTVDPVTNTVAGNELAGCDLSALDYVILGTGWEQHWGTAQYYRDWPTLAVELAQKLAVAGLKGVGLDCPSSDPLDGRTAHDLFAAAGMINVENLANLTELPATDFELLVLPLKLYGTEASPVRAVALV